MKIKEIMELIEAFGESYECGSPTDPILTEIQETIEQAISEGPQMQRGTDNDGNPWFGSMLQCLHDERLHGEIVELEIDRLLAEIKDARKRTATMFANKFQSDLDNYIAAHKLEWDKTNEAVRGVYESVIKELRGDV